VLDSLLLNESVCVDSEDALSQFILKLGHGYRNLLRHIQIVFLSDDGLSLLREYFEIRPESVWQFAVEWIADLYLQPSPSLESRIISDFPEIFAEFQDKDFELLWRSSRDGFGASEFHRRCDGHANMLTVILDTNWNIFGGFTPVEWESREWNGDFGEENNGLKDDKNQKSFVFTLKNPKNISARKFVLKDRRSYRAMICDSCQDPYFGDILVLDRCNGTDSNSTCFFGFSYIKDPELDHATFFMSVSHFQVQEIEVFKM
jgi:hypothetical protein